MTLNDLEPQNRGFSDFFCNFRLQHIPTVNCNEMDGDRPGQPAKMNCYRLMSFARITCLFFGSFFLFGSDQLKLLCFLLTPQYWTGYNSQLMGNVNVVFSI